MEWEKVVDNIRDLILGDIREELIDFKATVSGQLSGFALAIQSINAGIQSIESRQSNIESELRDIRRAIYETNKRIDELRVELKTEIMQNNQRIDETNKHIDNLYIEVANIRGDLNKALSQKEVIDDLITRVQRLEDRVLTAA
jgi:peptidoglycan hydrolase CwlO-like protein